MFNSEQTDKNIAEQICALHQGAEMPVTPAYTQDQLRRYIKYAKTFRPEVRRGSAAERLLVANYRKLRETDFAGVGKSAYRITVRQLEMTSLATTIQPLYSLLKMSRFVLPGAAATYLATTIQLPYSLLKMSRFVSKVRQLESMIRLSEALAKLHCDTEVTERYVREAFRLLKQTHITVCLLENIVVDALCP